jgi:arylformamidase
MLVYGHSAGGHLAACMFATDWAAHGLPDQLVPAAISISGLFDLSPLVHTSMNADLRLDETSARAVSPLGWPAPSRGRFDAMVGGEESAEFLRQSRTIVEAWQAVGGGAHYQEVAGTNHFTVIDALADPMSAMSARVAELAAPG